MGEKERKRGLEDLGPRSPMSMSRKGKGRRGKWEKKKKKKGERRVLETPSSFPTYLGIPA